LLITSDMKRSNPIAWALAALLTTACAPELVRGTSGEDATAAPALPARPDGAAMGPADTVTTTPDAGPSRDVTAPEDIPAPPWDAGVTSMDIGVPSTDIGVAPTDIPAPSRDVVAPPRDASAWRAMVGVPRIDASLKGTLRALYLRGLAMGNRAGVFAKIGDSITESASFLADFGPASGTASWNLGAYTALDPTRAFFNATLVDEHHSSFDRESLCAVSGWSTGRALAEGEALIQQELRALRPAVAFVMFGSADIEVLEVSEMSLFRSNLSRIVQIVVAAGTIPVLVTVPDRSDSPTAVAQSTAFVAGIREVAASQRVPLQDYWAALQPLPNRGVSEDGVHPSIYRTADGNTEAAYFTSPALAYGYNMRNLITLATLAHLRAIVFEDGPADP